VHAELSVRAREVPFDRLVREAELIGNFRVGAALSHEYGNSLLDRRQGASRAHVDRISRTPYAPLTST